MGERVYWQEMKSLMIRVSGRLRTLLSSPKFFWFALALFVLGAALLAATSIYPMAFDEDFHLGIIRLYAEVWNPFALAQTPNAAVFGSVVTDPSYLFHYLLSFPYRLLEMLGASEMTTVLTLRLLNVACFAASVVVFRRVLLRAGLSPLLAHGVLVFALLIPASSMLAAQINYDNVIMLITAVSLLLMLRVREGLLAGKLALTPLIWLAILQLLAAIVKYAYLPIVAGILLYLVILLVRHARSQRIWHKAWQTLRQRSFVLQTTLGVLLVVSLLLFAQRYVGNLVTYHDIVPDCGVVLTVDECNQYSVWRRDTALHTVLTPAAEANLKSLPHYVATDWLWGMQERLFFTVSGPTLDHLTRGGLRPLKVVMIGVASIGLLAFVIFVWQLLRRYPVLWLFVTVILVYVGVLIVQQYGMYRYTGAPVAINGRYLLPLLPLFGALAALGLAELLRRLRWTATAPLLITIVLLVCALQGGGAMTYIVQSSPDWYYAGWTRELMTDLRETIAPLIPGSWRQ
jgi:hypothetical protein